MANTLPAEQEDAFWSGVAHARRFFMGNSDVHSALERLARLLDEEKIPYAVIGAMALNEWGYRRVTVDVDLLVTPEGLQALRSAALGRRLRREVPGQPRPARHGGWGQHRRGAGR